MKYVTAHNSLSTACTVIISLSLSFLVEDAQAYSAKLVAPTQNVKITAEVQKHMSRPFSVSQLQLKATCYQVKKKVSLALIDGKYLRMPVNVKATRNRNISILKGSLDKARARCDDSVKSGSDRSSPSDNNKSSGSIVPIPLLAQWRSNMITMARKHCQALENGLTGESALAATYYDAEWVFYQIGDYTGDRSWYQCAQLAESRYRDEYVMPNAGVIPGYWNFTHGMTRDYLSTGDRVSQSGAILLAQRAAFASDTTPLGSSADASMSREVAYAIMSYLNAENVGQPHRPRTEQLVAQALGHVRQWTVSRNAEYVRPFMFALTAQALITYNSERGGNSQILPTLVQGADWIWENCWLPSQQAFKYTDRNVSSGGTEPAPDLNLLIAPVYAWLWNQTGEPRFRERADQIFVGGVKNAYITNPKQFNQNYRWSFDFVKWRSQAPRG